MTQKLIRRIGIGAAAISLAGMVHGLGMNNPVANAQTTRLRPDLNGLQLRNPGNGMIFWVDQGRIRHIVGPSVYNSLFIPRSMNAIDTVSITSGPPITADNRLVRCGESNHSLRNRIYLLDQGQKRHIASPEVMNRNSFNWDRVSTIACPALAAIPDGPTIR